MICWDRGHNCGYVSTSVRQFCDKIEFLSYSKMKIKVSFIPNKSWFWKNNASPDMPVNKKNSKEMGMKKRHLSFGKFVS